MLKKIRILSTSGWKKIKKFWPKFLNQLQRVFKAPKEVHIFRKRLVWGIALGIIFIIVALIVVFGVGLYKYNWQNRPAKLAQRIIPYPAAIVGSDFILLKDYNKRVNSLEHYYQATGQKPEEGYKKAVLEEMINHQIIEIGARKYNILVTDKEVEDSYQQLVAGKGGEEQVKNLLSQLWGYDIFSFKQLIKEKLLEEKVKSEIPVSNHLKHLLVKMNADADQQTREAIQAKAQGYYNEIKAGKSIAEEAKQFSEDINSKDNGGDLGWLSIDQINQTLGKDCLDKINAAKVKDLILCQSPNGFHVILIDERKGRITESFDNWFNETKKKAKIWRIV